MYRLRVQFDSRTNSGEWSGSIIDLWCCDFSKSHVGIHSNRNFDFFQQVLRASGRFSECKKVMDLIYHPQFHHKSENLENCDLHKFKIPCSRVLWRPGRRPGGPETHREPFNARGVLLDDSTAPITLWEPRESIWIPKTKKPNPSPLWIDSQVPRRGDRSIWRQDIRPEITNAREQ